MQLDAGNPGQVGGIAGWRDLLRQALTAPGRRDLVRRSVELLRTLPAPWRRQRPAARGVLLQLASLPLLLAAVIALAAGSLSGFATAVTAWLLVQASVRLMRRAQLERLLLAERRFTRPARLPSRPLALATVAAGTTLAAHGLVGQDLAVALVYGCLAGLGSHLAYARPHARSADQVRPAVPDAAAALDAGQLRALREAESRLLALEEAAYATGNSELASRLNRIGRAGHRILDHLAARPEDLYRARRFLNVYLEGAERVAGRYAKAHRFVQGGALENEFRVVLAQIEDAFNTQHRRLLDRDLADLDVQIAVLRRQLESDGLGKPRAVRNKEHNHAAVTR